MPRQFYPLPQAVLDGIARKRLGVAYCADSPMQILDLYYPDQPSEGPYPLILHTHGGAFANGDQRENNLEPMLRGSSAASPWRASNTGAAARRSFPRSL